MGYALFAQRKLVLTANLNSVSLQQTQRSNEQFLLATHTLSLQAQLSSLQAAQASELADKYEELAETTDSDKRNSINAEISAMQQRDKAELDDINRQIYQVGVKEQAIELQVKRLDTQYAAYEKQLEAVEDAEGKAIDRATPKFSGIG